MIIENSIIMSYQKMYQLSEYNPATTKLTNPSGIYWNLQVTPGFLC